ncbi:hypothetical protein NoPa_00047 [Pseudomonas phage vB_PpuM-NoPa]|uniref:Uncharacterized protein n=4 Tax=Tartuvirus TaxID=3424912 RepID=A0AAX4MYL3_9CAUD
MTELVVGKKYRVKTVNGFDKPNTEDSENFGGKIVTLCGILRYHSNGEPDPLDVYHCSFEVSMAEMPPHHQWSFYKVELGEV